MTKASDNIFPKVTFVEGSAPSSPSATDFHLYFDSADHLLKWKNSAGTVTTIGTGSADLAGKELDYVAFTSPVSITATSEATANTIVTGSSVAYDGSTIVLIEFYCPYYAAPASAATDNIFCLYDGSSSIGFIGLYSVPSNASNQRQANVSGARRLTPSNASHTYSIRAYVSVGTGSVGAGVGGIGAHMPGFIRITRVSS